MKIEIPNENRENHNDLSEQKILDKGKFDRWSEEDTLTSADNDCSRLGLTSGRIRHKNLDLQAREVGNFMGKSIWEKEWSPYKFGYNFQIFAK